MLIVAGNPWAAARLADCCETNLPRDTGCCSPAQVQNREELPATTGSYFLQRASGACSGKLLKFVHKA